MKLSELIAAVPGCRVSGRTDVEITGISLDSRTVREGYLFAAIAGVRDDGNRYTDDARLRGAVAVLTQRDVGNGGRLSYLVADDARMALALLADKFYGSPSSELDIVGITGTNGKTTVAYLTASILRAGGRKPALLGTIEYLIGARSIPAERTTPEAPQLQGMLREAVREGCDCVVMEVSSHALEQKRVAGVAFDIAVFTNMGSDHLDYHGDSERYFAAKASLFRAGTLQRAVVNSDDSFGARLASTSFVPVMTYGTDQRAAVRAERIRMEAGGSRFDLVAPQGAVGVIMPLLGRYNISNALAAAASALSMGVPLETIAATLAAARPVPGRLDEVPLGRPYRVFVDYAHTAEALENALGAVREGCRGRVILVFGCGGDRDRSKRAPMGRVAARCADLAIVTSDNPRRENPLVIIAEVAKGFAVEGKRCREIPGRREAIAAALREARPGDTVLVAGKGHERTQECGATVLPFSDRDVIMELAHG
ncbi:MAG: UDP-N-acetylmuramoyl-L-alanyl-D-glutamate--2,6-diaminopimelate ligase [Candidatus Aureabacteria bacterium]|nr:UDP-N-acetylmuramoyl-L-alanyl-D-glutamate--2,6-diaminopimelate ligase [Candidatus Auribacterota bacterium]